MFVYEIEYHRAQGGRSERQFEHASTLLLGRKTEIGHSSDRACISMVLSDDPCDTRTMLYIHFYFFKPKVELLINEPVELTMKVQYPNYVSSCYSLNSTVYQFSSFCSPSLFETFRYEGSLTETTLPPISPRRISLIKSSTPIAPGKSFLLAKTSNGTDCNEGRPRRACSSDVAVGRDFVYTLAIIWLTREETHISRINNVSTHQQG